MQSEGLLIGDPRSRRTAALAAAFVRAGRAVPSVMSWHDLLDAGASLSDAVASQRPAWIKIDSPGEDPALELRLIELGALQHGATFDRSPLGRSELRDQHHAFAGLAAVLSALERVKFVEWLNHPAEIRVMFDKLASQRLFVAQGVPTTEVLGPIEGYDEFIALLASTSCDRAFLKPRYGSSAAGVVAYQRTRRGRELAIANCELGVDGCLYNVLAPRRLMRRVEIAALVDALARQSLFAERWVSKPRVPRDRSRCFDLRVVAFRGAARQRVARTSRSPLTNLNLGNRRAAVAECLAPGDVARVDAAVAAAARAFPRSASIGFDMIPRGDACVCIEANAFGDLLPGVVWAGCETWDDQVAFLGAAGRAVA